MANMRPIGDFFRKISVVDCELTKTRVGGSNDGGYVVLKELCDVTDKVLTLGVGNDISFELEFTERFPQVSSYTLCDPTITSLPCRNDRFVHIKKYAHQLYPEGFREHTGNSLLKCDIECHEWELLREIKSNDLKRFNQILIELHLFHVEHKENGHSPYFHMIIGDFFEQCNVEIFQKYKVGLDKILENFYIFHIHANNSLPVSNLDAWTFPPLLELSLVRKDLVENVAPSKDKFPTPLDRPNKTDRPDIENYYPIIGWRGNELACWPSDWQKKKALKELS